ncbi:hypothetical protein [Massilia timonae]|nr:hypothetical protein [Massilia timonae]
MSIDRELLELAAQAYFGADGFEWNACAGSAGCIQFIPPGRRGYVNWEPLTDDGDALRLAVKLQLTVCNEHVSAGVAYCTQDDITLAEERSGSNETKVIDADFAATRRAITLAAAEIGRMESR